MDQDDRGGGRLRRQQIMPSACESAVRADSGSGRGARSGHGRNRGDSGYPRRPHIQTDPDFLDMMLAFRAPDGRRIHIIGINDRPLQDERFHRVTGKAFIERHQRSSVDGCMRCCQISIAP